MCRCCVPVEDRDRGPAPMANNEEDDIIDEVRYFRANVLSNFMMREALIERFTSRFIPYSCW